MSASPEPSLAPDGRIVLLVVSPRVAPGQLTWPAWQGLREADTVLAADLDDDWWEALTGAGVEPVVAAETLPGARARLCWTPPVRAAPPSGSARRTGTRG